MRNGPSRQPPTVPTSRAQPVEDVASDLFDQRVTAGQPERPVGAAGCDDRAVPLVGAEHGVAVGDALDACW